MAVLLLAWPVGLAFWANGRINHVEALSGVTNTPGTTYLLVGSDSRADGAVGDGEVGNRSDTILLLQKASNGQTSMVSLPRDTLVEIPGHGQSKLNASYSIGGAPLLVATVEHLTSHTVDHYVEIGMGGVVSIVDAVGGVNLCYDRTVQDELSGLHWEEGCHDVDGETALAFARMRYSDPLGDFGRQARQRQVISAVVKQAASPTTLLPHNTVNLVNVGTAALSTDPGSGIVDLGFLALAFRSASGEGGLTGAPPIANPDYRVSGLGSTVLLSDTAPDFFARMLVGELSPADFGQ